MASNPDEVKRAAMAELARRELARRQSADPVDKFTSGALLNSVWNGQLGQKPAQNEPLIQRQIDEGLMNLGTGMAAYPIGAAAGLAGIAGDVTGLYPNDPAATEQKVGQALTYQPSEPNAISTVAGLPGRALGYVGEKLSQAPGIKGTPYLESISKRLPEAAANALALYSSLKALSEAAPTPTRPPTDNELAAKTLNEAGVPTYKYQVSESGTLKNAQAAADQLPFSGATTASRTQKSAFNRAVMKLMGSDADNAKPAVMGQIKDRLGTALDTVEDNTTLSFSTDLAKDLREIVDSAPTAELKKFAMDKIASVAKNTQEGKISGKTFATLKQVLDKDSGSTVPGVGEIARDIRGALQNEVGRSIPPEMADFYQTTRSQYQMMKQVEGAIDKYGNISPQKLFNVFGQKKNRYQGVYGKGEQSLASLARAGAQVLPETVPNSGTTPRLLYGAALGGGALINPTLAALGAASGLTVPRMLRSLPSGAGGPMARQVTPPIASLAAILAAGNAKIPPPDKELARKLAQGNK